MLFCYQSSASFKTSVRCNSCSNSTKILINEFDKSFVEVLESIATNIFANEFYECWCKHDCGFSGPSVCGNNSILYLNRCRMTSATCELNIHIEIRDKEFCQSIKILCDINIKVIVFKIQRALDDSLARGLTFVIVFHFWYLKAITLNYDSLCRYDSNFK